jgi:hypothetical protein
MRQWKHKQPTAQTARKYLNTGRDLVTNLAKYFLHIINFILILSSQNGYFTNNQEFVRGLGAKMRSGGQPVSENK